MNLKTRNRLIIAGLADDCLKFLSVAKRGRSLDFIDVVSFDLEHGHTHEYLRELVGRYLRKEDCGGCPIIISLPRSDASLKLVKVPSESKEEISRIISLHASTYLPCPPDRVCVSHEVVSSDAAGYSHVNLAVVNKDIIERYRGLLDGLSAGKPRVILSSFGLSWLYNHFYPGDSEDVVFVDADRSLTEICALSKGRLSASRYFKQDCLRPEWKEMFLKEMPLAAPAKIVITGGAYIDGLAQAVKDRTGLKIEVLSYIDKFRAFREYGMKDCSFASLLGVALHKRIEAPFIFMSAEEKKKEEKRSGALKLAKFLVLLLIFVFALSAALNFDIKNKEAYVIKIDREMDGIKSEARKLERMKARIDLFSSRPSGKSLILGILSGIYEAIPDAVSLSGFHYDAGETKTVLRGEARGIDSVFLFVSRLEGLSVLKGYKVKLNYATNKKTSQGEITNFEITCLK